VTPYLLLALPFLLVALHIAQVEWER